jgi:hypothetical protein
MDLKRPYRWRLRVRVNRFRGRSIRDYCWWCGSAWDGRRCECCGNEVVASASGTVKGVPISEEQLPGWARELFDHARRSR